MSKKILNIKDRVLYLAENKEVNKQIFFKKTNLNYSNFTGKSKESDLNSKSVAEILLIYPDVNAVWLLTGEGSMLKEEKESIYSQKDDVLHVNKEFSTYHKSKKTCDETIAENYQLKDDKMNLMQESKALMQQNSALMEDKITLIQENSDLKVENITLKQKLKELETLKKTTRSH